MCAPHGARLIAVRKTAFHQFACRRSKLSMILTMGQAGRDEHAKLLNDTGKGIIRAHAKVETLIVRAAAFDEAINRRHFLQVALGGTGETYGETDGKLGRLGFSALRLVGPTKTEEILLTGEIPQLTTPSPNVERFSWAL
jgi:hypothetical protein